MKQSQLFLLIGNVVGAPHMPWPVGLAAAFLWIVLAGLALRDGQ